MEFPWIQAVNALDRNDAAGINGHFQRLLDTLVPFIIMPPPGDGKAACQPPTFSSEVDCSQYPSAFTGVPRKVSAMDDNRRRTSRSQVASEPNQALPCPLHNLPTLWKRPATVAHMLQVSHLVTSSRQNQCMNQETCD